MRRHCPFCHKEILWFQYERHYLEHTRLRPDGQQEEHVTSRPEERYAGSLEGVPKVYFHAKCGQCTGMPEEIIRSYLANPFLYNGTTFCCGCHTYVPEGELTWVETGERLSDYMAKLKATARGT